MKLVADTVTNPSKHQILVVDDDPIVRDCIASISHASQNEHHRQWYQRGSLAMEMMHMEPRASP